MDWAIVCLVAVLLLNHSSTSLYLSRSTSKRTPRSSLLALSQYPSVAAAESKFRAGTLMAGDAAFDLSQFNKKRILQEMNQYLFEGANPKLKWSDDRSTLSVILDHDCVYNFTCDVSKGPISRVDRMIFEESSAERVIEELLTSSPYQYALRTWLAMRLNRENEPFVWASTASIIEHVKDSGVRMLVFVDVENVPDFKKRFYSDSSGAIRFTSPYIPKLLVAPSLSDVNDDALAQASPVGLTRGTSDNSDLHEYTDENVLVLAYAHAGATISNYANRIISSLRPNAADALLQMDLAALVHTCGDTVGRCILVTGDHYGENVRTCIMENQDAGMETGKASAGRQAYRSGDAGPPRQSQKQTQSQPASAKHSHSSGDSDKSMDKSMEFFVVETCREAAECARRLPF